MPIYTQSYRSYDGQAKTRFRWWIVVKHELSLVFKTRQFLVLVAVGYLPILLRVLQVVTVDSLMSGRRNNPIIEALRQFKMMTVDANMFLDVIRFQAPVVFLVCIMAGGGMICSDFRNNLVDVYFAKPLNWRDYVAGKVTSLMLLGYGFTAIPAMFLWILHLSLSPTMETFSACYWFPWPILAFSTILVAPCAIGVLASSALSRNERYAQIAVFMLLLGDLVTGRVLPDLLHNVKYAVIAFPLALNRLGEALFHQARPVMDIPVDWSLAFAALVTAAAVLVVCRKARRAEIPA